MAFSLEYGWLLKEPLFVCIGFYATRSCQAMAPSPEKNEEKHSLWLMASRAALLLPTRPIPRSPKASPSSGRSTPGTPAAGGAQVRPGLMKLCRTQVAFTQASTLVGWMGMTRRYIRHWLARIPKAHSTVILARESR